MPNSPNGFFQMLTLALLSVGAGALDYFHDIQSGRRKWQFLAFVLHLCLALLTGTIAVMVTTEMGFSIHAAGAAAGGAGFLNVRLFNLAEAKLKQLGDSEINLGVFNILKPRAGKKSNENDDSENNP